MERPKIPLPSKVYGNLVYWLCVIACVICILGPALAIAFVDKNVLNPHFLFFAIWEGKTAAEVWQAGGGFPGGVFGLFDLFTGDGFTQLGLAIGCGSAGIALLFTAVAFLRERAYRWVLVSIWVAALVIFAAAGIVEIK